MSKFWLNEKVLVLCSILILLLFLGFIALFDSWMKIILAKLETAECPTVQVNPADRIMLEDQIAVLIKSLDDISDQPDRASDACFFVSDGGGSECRLTVYDIYLALGLAHYRLGRDQEARDYLYLALEEKQEPFIYGLLVENEWQACRYKAARNYLLKAIELDPGDYHSWQKLIRLEKEHFRADFKRLRFLYSQAVEAVNDEVAFTGYAHFLEENRHYSEAADLWQLFVEQNPVHRDLYQPQIDRLRSKIN